MFGFGKKALVFGAIAKGEAVGLEKVSDPTFRDKLLGDGMAFIPSEGKIYAPVDGEVSLVFDTLHALSINAENGAEILIHVGLDTVQLKGQGFDVHVSIGDSVRRGDLLMTVDLDAVKAAGYDTVTPVVICNSGDFSSIELLKQGEVNPGDDVLQIKK